MVSEKSPYHPMLDPQNQNCPHSDRWNGWTPTMCDSNLVGAQAKKRKGGKSKKKKMVMEIQTNNLKNQFKWNDKHPSWANQNPKRFLFFMK